MNIQELIAKKQKEMQAKSAAYLKPSRFEEGKTILRILPTWRKPGEGEPEFWHDYGLHYVPSNDGKKTAHICNDKTHGKPCEICQTIGRAISSSTDDKLNEQLKGCNANQRYLVNAINVGAKKTEVEVFELPKGVFEAIMDLIMDVDSGWGDVTDWDEGRPLTIVRSGSGLNTKYTVTPMPKLLPIKSETYQEKLFDLDALVTVDDVKTRELVSLVAGIGGIAAAKMIPSSTAALAPSASFPASEDSDDDIDDAVFEPVSETPEELSGDDMSELDELFEELG